MQRVRTKSRRQTNATKNGLLKINQEKEAARFSYNEKKTSSSSFSLKPHNRLSFNNNAQRRMQGQNQVQAAPTDRAWPTKEKALQVILRHVL